MTYEEIAKRMRETADLKNDSALAGVFEITPQALSNYKKKGKMPASLILKFAEKYDCSIDHLVKGTEEETKGEKMEISRLPAAITLQDLAIMLRADDYNLELRRIKIPEPVSPPVVVPEVITDEEPEGFDDIEPTTEGTEETH